MGDALNRRGVFAKAVGGLVLPAVLVGLTGYGPTPVTAPPGLAPTTASDQPSRSPPLRIRLPSLSVDAPVTASGVDERGEMQVPDNIREIGWYRFSPLPGSAAGSSVVAGHVDDRVQGRGAFYDLAALAVGDPVVVTTTAGVDLDYRVRVSARSRRPPYRSTKSSTSADRPGSRS